MLLIDRVSDYGDEHIEVAARLAPQHWLASERGIPCWVGLELMAQTVSAFSGLELRALGKPPRIGLLLGTRSYQAHAPYFPAGVELTVFAKLAWRDAGGLGVFDCVVREGGRELARARVKGYAPEEIDTYLQADLDG